MYKSKLQQLCHHRLWPLPTYSAIKHGPDHCPIFKASVLVNGASFDSAPACKSSKEAQNDAAMRAILRLGSDPPAPPHSDLEIVEDEPPEPEMKNEALDLSSELLANALASNDVQYPYKLQLHTYAQRNNLSLPSYSTTSIGPPHACHFVACVTVGEQEFKSPTPPSRTVKEAENVAAKAALESLSPDGFEQISSGYVKNLLQELAQKEGLSAPKYKTSTSGALHMQMFYSTVEVGGEVFQGKAARSKKLSLINAAEVAYQALEERRLNQKSSAVRRASPEVKDQETKNHSDFTKSVKYQEEGKPTDPAMTRASLQGEFGALSMADPGPAHSAACQSYLLCNRVRVYTSVPDIKFPKGVCLLQVADDKWVPVSLEYPCEKDV
uniref:DRBM domain-containing protein n=1 Tax=Kalanchoe fedtschenkoi TaxID=63787 RepID=A0A7N1A4I9_KALFE